MKDSLELLDGWLREKERNGNFYVPPAAVPALITAVSGDEAFDPAFLRGLYILEQAMLEKEMDPASFSLMKYRVAAGAGYPGAADTNIVLYGYKVMFGQNAYTVRRKSDLEFLAYFSTLLLGDDMKKAEDKPSLLTRLMDWFRKDAF